MPINQSINLSVKWLKLQWQRHNNASQNKFSLAFTLAEVLIVMGIIGIIAEITIPTLMSGVEDKSSVVALQKEVGVIQGAITMAQSQEGTIDQWYSTTGAWDAKTVREVVNTVLAKYLKVEKNCKTESGCLPTDQYRYLSLNYGTGYDTTDYNSDSYSKMLLADGSTVIIVSCAYSGDISFKILGQIVINLDVNGPKGPNRWGYDLFRVIIRSSDAVINTFAAQGLQQSQIVTPFPPGSVNRTGDLKTFCSRTATDLTGSGYSCTAWAYYQHNRDYLYCDDLNWETKTSCSQ